MFKPSYIISEKLLFNIKKINTLVVELNNKSFPKLIFYQFEKKARTVSAFASTSIEGNPLPLTEVKKIIKSEPEYICQTEKEVLNYNQVLIKLNQELKQEPGVSIKFILRIHEQAMKDLVLKPGYFRKHPVVVNNPLTGKTVYLPPDVKDVLVLMKELLEFININQKKIDPLILAGIFHKQFVIIHPFMDGNGRTVRLATKALLVKMGLNTFNLFSFENYYNKNVTEYFKQVGEYGSYYEIVKKIDFTSWLEYFSEGIIDELLRVKKELEQVSLTPETELKPYHKKILDFIKNNGYITDRNYSKLTSRAKATRNLDFQKLIKLGLIERKGKGRASYYKLKK